MSEYLGFIEQDGAAWGGFVPELHVTVTGKSRAQVMERLSEGAALALLTLAEEGRPLPQALLRSAADLDAEQQQEVQGLEAVRITPATVSSTSIAVQQAIEHSGRTRTAIAREMGTSPAAITRLTDPFYFEHSLHSLRALAQVLSLPLARFVGLKDLALDEYLSSGDALMPLPGHVTLRRTPELERLPLPALVRWQGLLFWLDRPAAPPFTASDEQYLVFEGSMVDDHGYTRSILSVAAG